MRAWVIDSDYIGVANIVLVAVIHAAPPTGPGPSAPQAPERAENIDVLHAAEGPLRPMSSSNTRTA